jgi:hypothetical protein
LAKLEKYFLKNNVDLGPIGPPSNGVIWWRRRTATNLLLQQDKLNSWFHNSQLFPQCFLILFVFSIFLSSPIRP